ncbi:hypothetical protein I4U23_007860 [Adineta vaga]|nr:hypothetical protein I4U23_007860 [Adineta vaga]
MMLSTRQTLQITKSYLQMILPSLTMFGFLSFALLMASMIILSIIPLYLDNQSMERTRFILTTVRMSNYSLHTSRSLGKRDLTRLILSTNVSTLDDAQMTMNRSIQYALEQQLKANNNPDKFNIFILQMLTNTDDLNNMSVTLDILIVYTRECVSCDRRRQLTIFEMLCSNNQLSTPINILIQYTNLSYALSDATIMYTSYIPIENIVVITKIISNVPSIDQINSNELLIQHNLVINF